MSMCYNVPAEIWYVIFRYIPKQSHFILNHITKEYKPFPKAKPLKSGISTIDQFHYYNLKKDAGTALDIAKGYEGLELLNIICSHNSKNQYFNLVVYRDIWTRDPSIMIKYQAYYNSITFIKAIEENNIHILRLMNKYISFSDIPAYLVELLIKKHINYTLKHIIFKKIFFTYYNHFLRVATRYQNIEFMRILESHTQRGLQS